MRIIAYFRLLQLRMYKADRQRKIKEIRLKYATLFSMMDNVPFNGYVALKEMEENEIKSV
jgi:hypothetical protein